MKDWIEIKTEQLLAAGRKTGFFDGFIRDARDFAKEGYAWDVALAMSLEYWAR